MAASSATVTGKAGPGDTVTALKLTAQRNVNFNIQNGVISVDGVDIDISACTTVTCVVTAGTPPAFAFTIS